jgi:viroplasmin and RNaseH domain-containing protein
MKKWYAVRVGKIPGIYRSWSECREQVHKYSGAVFKSFHTEDQAKTYMNTPFPSAYFIKKENLGDDKDDTYR